jgi:hypothetical protein
MRENILQHWGLQGTEDPMRMKADVDHARKELTNQNRHTCWQSPCAIRIVWSPGSELIHICMCACVCVSVHACMYMYKYIYTHVFSPSIWRTLCWGSDTDTYTHTHIHTQIHTHIHVSILKLSLCLGIVRGLWKNAVKRETEGEWNAGNARGWRASSNHR